MAEKSSTFSKSVFGGFLGTILALCLAFGVYLAATSEMIGLSALVKSGGTIVIEGSQEKQHPWSGYNRGDKSPSEVVPPVSTPGTVTSPEANQNATTTIILSEDTTAIAEVVAEMRLPSVVAIDIYTNRGNSYGYSGGASGGASGLSLYSLGSGVILTADGYVLTNYHVIEGGDEIRVTAAGQEYSAWLVGSDASSDLAVLKMELPEGVTVKPFAIGNSDNLKPGQWVMTIGSPFGYEQSVATGIVSALGRSQVMQSNSSGDYQLYANLIQTDASINPGNSGGALVNAKGELVGINTLITSKSGNYSGVGFAIPSNYAYAIATQIINGQTPTHASLGVSMATITTDNAARYGVDVRRGAYISRVYEGTGAERAGILEGDVVLSFEGKNITSATDLMLAIRSHQIGDTVSVVVLRDGEELELTATLGSDAE